MASVAFGKERCRRRGWKVVYTVFADLMQAVERFGMLCEDGHEGSGLTQGGNSA